jgi:hypothetical protein
MSKKWLNWLLFLLFVVWFVVAMYKRDGNTPYLNWIAPIVSIALVLVREYVISKNRETNESPNNQ